MKNYEILSAYKKSDLRRLAKGKTSEIVGIDYEKILINLSKILGNYESIRNNIEFRKPPIHTILEVLFEASDYLVKYDDLKSLVKQKIKEYQKQSSNLNLNDSEKNYRLYAKVLDAAWEYEGDLLPSESNILRVLRDELNISKKEHQLIMAHPEINRLSFNDDRFQNELAYLSREGILLVYRKSDESYFALSDETVDSLKKLWGIELEPEQYYRMLTNFDNHQLHNILKTFNLHLSGTHTDRINRIISNDIKPSELLTSLSTSNLSDYLKRTKLSTSGNKEEKIMKLMDLFESDKDLKEPEPKPKKEIIVEERLLSEEKIIDMLLNLSNTQLHKILDKLKLSKSGVKNVRIDRLLESGYNEKTFLNILSLNDLKEISKSIGLKTNEIKPNLIKNLISYFRELVIKESKLHTQQLFEFYNELSCQDNRIYLNENISEPVTCTTIGLDFERITKYIFKNIFKLEIKTQKFGKAEPDGKIWDDEGNMYYYECKTILNPPYELPIGHRLQIRNYIQSISGSKDKGNFKGYIIISHSFSDNIDKKIEAIESPIDIPISVIEAKDLLAFAKKWEADYHTDTFPIKQLIKKGRIRLKDFEKVI